MKNFVLILIALLCSTAVTSAQWVKCPAVGFEGNVNNIASNDKYVFTTDSKSLYRSTDKGETWEKHSREFYGITNIYLKNDLLIITRANDVHASYDCGVTWTDSEIEGIYIISDIASTDNAVFCNSSYELFRSTDSCRTWEEIAREQSFVYNYSLINIGNRLVMSIKNNLIQSDDDGNTWNTIITDSNAYFYKLFYNNGKLYCSSQNNNVLLIDIDKKSFEKVSEKFDLSYSVYKISNIISVGEKVFITNTSYCLAMLDSNNKKIKYSIIPTFNIRACNLTMLNSGRLILSSNCGILISDDSGRTWRNVVIPINEEYITNIFATSFGLFGTTGSKALYRSCDNGMSWQRLLNDLSEKNIDRIFQRDSVLYASVKDSVILTSVDSGNTWTNFKPISGVKRINDVFYYKDLMLVATDVDLFQSAYPYSSWVPNSLENGILRIDEKDGIFIALSYKNLFCSVSESEYWAVSEFENEYLNDFGYLNNSVLAMSSRKLYLSTDSCHYWTIIDTVKNGDEYECYYRMVTFGDILIICKNNEIKATNSLGKYWTECMSGFDSTVDKYYSLVKHGNNLFAVTNDGLYKLSLSDLVLSAEETRENVSVRAFPNPCSDRLSISSEQEIGRITVFDVFGREYPVSTRQSGCETVLNTSGLPVGTLFLKIETHERLEVIKINITR